MQRLQLTMQASLLTGQDLADTHQIELPSLARDALEQLHTDLSLATTAARSARAAPAPVSSPGRAADAPRWLRSLCKEVEHGVGAQQLRAHASAEPAAQWAACGHACARLTCDELARDAFAESLSATRSLTCSLAAARVAASVGAVWRTLDALTDALLHMDALRPARWQGDVSMAVLACASQLVSSAGMRAVQAVLESAVGQVHPLVETTIELAFERGTDGCDD